MISPLILIVTATLTASVAGLPLLISPVRGERTSCGIMLAASLLGITGALQALLSVGSERWLISWGLPFGPAEIGIDPLSAIFLILIFLVSACCSIYARGYLPASENRDTAPKLSTFFGILTGSLAGIVIARHAVLFLMVWEIMAIACYLAITIESRKKEVREAGLLYLITAHFGTLALFVYFSKIHSLTGSFSFPESGTLSGSSEAAAAIFIAALIGFGLKAGIMPLHIWLPSAHANAPSHLSAMMSGVLIKMGIYGIIRTVSLFSSIPFWWGVTILLLGVISGVIGVIFAIAQHDIKRLLAYHSIENIGIILMGIGVCLMGVSNNIPALVVLGMAGALLHTLNHAIFKSLLFLGAGAIIHACGSREIDQMGGLIKKIPLTALFFLVGAVAICGLPPLNGFVSEWLIYIGLFKGMLDADTLNDPYFALAAPALALIGALAAACFVKVFGIAFLGSPRSDAAAEAHDTPLSMKLPMGILAGFCILIGLFPQGIAPLLQITAASIFPVAAGAALISESASLGVLSAVSALLMILIGVAALLYKNRLSKSPVKASETWGCGYLAPTARMQYTSSSFAAILNSLFSSLLRPHTKDPDINGYFPKNQSFRSHTPEALLEKVYLPLFDNANSRLSLFRKLQHGKLHLYILYIVVTLISLLAWSHFRMRG
ncbi:MAG: hydrogenase [Geobacteraceae bacterium]|nr:hydrogenase [Geobacteraceae bacterium]